MTSTKPNPMNSFGRGIFGLKNWEPLRKPLGRGIDKGVSGTRVGRPPTTLLSGDRPGSAASSGSDSSLSRKTASPSPAQAVNNGSSASNKRPGPVEVPKKGCALLAKYGYTANPNSPLGHELTFKLQDKLKFIEVHSTNPEWWVAETSDGTLGYVPAKYMMSLEVTSLPWLQGRKVEEEENQLGNNTFGGPPKGYIKPYNSTYDHPELKKSANGSGGVNDWRCDICEKDFNGPKPYQAHMVSKAHKEELALRDENNS